MPAAGGCGRCHDDLVLMLLLVPVATQPPPWAWPLVPARVVSQYDPPALDWSAGHRGIDLAAGPGASVRAVAAGTVAFAGSVAGVGTVSIEHGTVRSTYQPVRSTLRVGDEVWAGAVIGTVAGQLAHCPDTCVHLGARTTTGYLDPMALLGRPRIVLKPMGRPAAPHADGPG